MPPATAITIGNFDGVHLGHIQLIRTARAAVGEDGRVTALSFDPHPSVVLRPHDVPPRLTTFAQRERLLRAAGADEVVALCPSKRFLHQEPEDFLSAIVDPYRPDVIVEGPDFRFGRHRAGTVETLRALESRHGHRTIVIDPVELALSDHSLVRVSSTIIRWLVQRGRMRDARLLLDQPFELEGPVVSGDRRGRKIGVPTANLNHGDLLLPADGIYSGMVVREGDGVYPAAISVGTKPTFGASARICEAFLLGFDGPYDDYGWTMRVQFRDWMRDQIAYPSAERLVEQLQRDIARVEAETAMAG